MLSKIVVLDFEATCQDPKAGWVSEIIEFPLVIVDVATQKIEAEFRTFVKPEINPKLTDFCTELTGIVQTDVDGGIPIKKALGAVHDFLKQQSLVADDGSKTVDWMFCTCGDWDLQTMLPIETKLKKISVMPYFKEWINIKKPFAQKYLHIEASQQERGRGTGAPGMPGMLKMLHLPLLGRHHSGIDDCKNIARIVIKMIQDNYSFTGPSSTFRESK